MGRDEREPLALELQRARRHWRGGGAEHVVDDHLEAAEIERIFADGRVAGVRVERRENGVEPGRVGPQLA